MSTSRWSRRAALLFLCCPVAFGVLGGDCEFSFPGIIVDDGPDVIVEDFVTIELVNETGFEVDPGLFFDDVYEDLGILLPGEAPPPIDLLCLPGDELVIDPLLFIVPEGVVADFAPLLVEGFDYLCGDVITIFYAQDIDGTFFVEVFVNDELLVF